MLMHIITTADPQILAAITDAKKVQLFTDALQRCQTDVDRAVASLSADGQHELHVNEAIETVVAGVDSVSKQAIVAGPSQSAPVPQTQYDAIEAVVAGSDSESIVRHDYGPAQLSVPPKPKYDAIEAVVSGVDSVSLASQHQSDGPTSSKATPSAPKRPNSAIKSARRENISMPDKTDDPAPSIAPLAPSTIQAAVSGPDSASLASRNQSDNPASSKGTPVPSAPKRRNSTTNPGIARRESISVPDKTVNAASSTTPPAPKRRNSTIEAAVSASKDQSDGPSPSKATTAPVETIRPSKAIGAGIARRESISMSVKTAIPETESSARPKRKRRTKAMMAADAAAAAGLEGASLILHEQTANATQPKPRRHSKATKAGVAGPATLSPSSPRAALTRNFDAIESVIAGLDSASIASQNHAHVTDPQPISAPTKPHVDTSQPVTGDNIIYEPNTTQTYTNGSILSDLLPEAMETQPTLPTSQSTLSQPDRISDECPESLCDFVEPVSNLLDENDLNLVRIYIFRLFWVYGQNC